MAGDPTAVFRCPLCRRSAFAGRRGHLYSAGHQRRLRAALARLGEKVAAAREAARRVAVLPFQAGEHERCVWCLCCAREVRRHLSRGARTVLHGGLLQHLASPEHGRAVAAFWRKNRADPKLKPDFLLSAAEYQRFQESLSKALDAYEAKEDAAIQEAAAHIREVEQKRQEMVQAILEPQRASMLGDGASAVNTFTGNLSDSPFAMEEQGQPGPSRSTTFLREEPICASRTVPELHYLETGQPLNFIGHQETGGEGNIHTGAKPPWLMSEEEEDERQIGPSYEEFLKEKWKHKLKKLPPNRVGANFDHSSQTGDGWLPSFGRVWNHGRRWQSRHQFKAESGNKQPGPKRKRP